MKLPRNLVALYGALLLVLTLGGSSLLFRHDSFETEILSLLPTIYRDRVVESGLRAQAQTIAGKVLVVVQSPTARQAEEHVEQIAGAMRKTDLFEHVDARLSGEDMKPLVELFMRHPFQLAPPLLDPTLSPTALVRDVQERAFSPEGLQWLRTADRDPLLLFPTYLRALLAQSGRFIPRNGYIHVSGTQSPTLLLSATLKGSAYSREVQTRAVQFLNSLVVPPSSKILTSGIILFAHDSAERAEREVTMITTLTTFAVITLIVLVFRSVGIVLLIVGSVFTSFLGSLWLTHTTFSALRDHGLHLITLGFGSCLLGVSVDYAIHFFVAHRSTSPHEATSPLTRIRPGLLLGFLTSVIGFLGIALSPFPGLQEVAAFCVIGLSLAITTVCIILPRIAGTPRFDAKIMRTATSLDTFLSRRSMTIPLIAIAALALLGLPKLSTIDDIRTLNTPSPHLLAQQQAVAKLIGFTDGGTVIVIEGDSEDAVLEREEAVRARLDGMTKEKQLDSYRALSTIIPSRQRQETTYRKYAALARSHPEALASLATTLHLPPQATEALTKLSTSQPQSFAGISECISTHACRTVEDLWLGKTGETHLSLIPLSGFRGDAATLLDGIAKTRVVNHADAISKALRLYRESATTITTIFYGVIFAILIARYGARRAIRVAVPALLGATAALSTLGLVGVPVNVFSVFALMVLLGVSIDYAIFFGEDSRRDPATTFAVILSAATTILSFGALSWSSMPALKSFGIVLSVGVATAAIFAPLARPRAEER